MQNEKVTVQIAAKALGVTSKTIHQWLKVGTLTRVKEGNRTYILMDEIRALRQNKVITSKRKVIGFDDDHTPGYNPGNNYLVIARDHYEGLLTRLGQLEAKQELLFEYKGSIEARDRTIADQRATIEAKEKELADLRAELERLRLPWYKRLWKRSKS